MKIRKIAIILISVMFAIALVVCVGAIFTVKKVDTVFSVSEGTKLNVEKARETLDKYVGKNLLFLDTEAVKETLEEDAYIEVVSVEKKFPNVIAVEVKERKEVYLINFNNENYALSEEGIVLSKLKGEINTRNYVALEFEQMNILTAQVGFKLNTDAPEMFSTALEIAKHLKLTDCIKQATITNQIEGESIAFSTYTGVSIVVWECLDDGVEKAKTAFEFYDKETEDYDKTYSEIRVIKEDNGNIVAVWTEHHA